MRLFSPRELFRAWIKLCEDVMPEEDEPQPEAMIDAFYDAFDASGLAARGVAVSLQVDPDAPETTVELNHISAKDRGKGLASQAMLLLTDLADRYNVALRLGVATDADGRNDSMTADQLVDWYMRWGFVGGQVMRRAPEEPR